MVEPVAVVLPAAPARPRWYMFRRGLLRDVVRGVFAVIVLHVFLIQVSIVRGDSMRPGLVDGDRLIVDRVSAAIDHVARFDVVVLGNPSDPRVDYVKRVVGLPGDRVALHEGVLTINDRVVEEDFGPVVDRVDFQSRVVPLGHCFVLGDNRPISRDSREFGMVPLELLRGVVRVRFWPLDRLHLF